MPTKLALTLVVAATNAASTVVVATNEAESVDLDYYLLEDRHGFLAMSTNPPSAANETTWTTRVDTPEGSAERTLRLDFPGADYWLDESQEVKGAVRASAVAIQDDAAPWVSIQTQSATLEVRLVEGERVVVLGTQGLSGTTSKLDFDGDYPGHGDDGGPHTHGDGSDVDRGLRLSDLRIELALIVEKSSGMPSSADAFEFRIVIDGNSFVHLVALDAVERNRRTAPEPEPTCEDACAPNNTTTPQKAPSGKGASASASVLTEFAASGTGRAVSLAGLASLVACVALVAWRRERR